MMSDRTTTAGPAAAAGPAEPTPARTSGPGTTDVPVPGGEPALATLLVLADSRLPAGGHAHSGGLEPAAAAGAVRDLASLAGFLRGRLATAGRLAAAFAAAACARPGTASALDVEFDARTPAPAARRASRTQGRALLRAGREVFPHRPTAGPAVGPPGPHHPVALGLVAASAGLTPHQAATAAAYAAVAGPAGAAVRLLGLDPYRVHALVAALAPDCDRLAAEAAGTAAGPPEALPAAGAPMLDVHAERHASWEVRLFAS